MAATSFHYGFLKAIVLNKFHSFFSTSDNLYFHGRVLRSGLAIFRDESVFISANLTDFPTRTLEIQTKTFQSKTDFKIA